MIERRTLILDWMRKNGEMTLAQATAASGGYYANGKQHIGAILRRMIAAGAVVRVKKGVYALARANQKPENDFQLTP